MFGLIYTALRFSSLSLAGLGVFAAAVVVALLLALDSAVAGAIGGVIG